MSHAAHIKGSFGVAVLPSLLVLLMLPVPAHAGNGTHIRTPVDWSGAPCMTIVDRSENPIVELSYAVPFEDTMLTEDEVADSRTHQFFGFCRDRSRGSLLPNWITEQDVELAVNAGLGDPSEVDFDQHILTNTPGWADCWVRITDDDERRPITFASGAEPVVWDTTALAAGTWVVDGYTHEPWTNLWAAHPGVFKIVDDPDPSASPPAASVDFPEFEVDFGQLATVSGCVDAMPGTKMSLAWAIATINEEPSWVEFASEVPAETGAFEVGFEPPIETVSNPVLIRVELRDPMDRSWVAYSRNLIGVKEGTAEGCEDPFGGCDETESEGGSGSDGGSQSGAPSDEAGQGGCNCSTHDADPPAPLWAGVGLVLVGLVWRRRSR